MRSILIVEDNSADQFLSKAIISSKCPDVEIHIAADGQEALEMLNGGLHADLILLDINMPRMNGHDFLEQFTNNNEREIPVVVMLTSSDQEEDKSNALSYKCVKDYLLKPIKPETLEKLQQIVKDSY